jgi:hypothetical protein
MDRNAYRESLKNAGIAGEIEAIYGKYNGATWDTTVAYSTGFFWVTIDTEQQQSPAQVTNPLGLTLSGGDEIYIARGSNMGRMIITKPRVSEGP